MYDPPFQGIVMLSLIVMYKNDPLIQVSPEWFVPLNKIIAFPTGVPGKLRNFVRNLSSG